MRFLKIIWKKSWLWQQDSFLIITELILIIRDISFTSCVWCQKTVGLVTIWQRFLIHEGTGSEHYCRARRLFSESGLMWKALWGEPLVQSQSDNQRVWCMSKLCWSLLVQRLMTTLKNKTMQHYLKCYRQWWCLRWVHGNYVMMNLLSCNKTSDQTKAKEVR